MQLVGLCLGLSVLGACADRSSGSSAAKAEQGGSIAKVVNMLQDMLDKSKADAAEDRDLHSKFMCYCDQNTETKGARIKDLQTRTTIVESKIEKLTASNGELSVESEQLKTAIAEVKAAIKAAGSLREKEHEAFLEEEKSLKTGIAQMDEAIKVLADVGADQTMERAGLTELRARVRKALVITSKLMAPKERRRVNLFLQAPFTGNYASQSGEVVGILKNMKETFTTNLANIITQEQRSLEQHAGFAKLKTESLEKLSAAYDAKQASLGENDDDLASKQDQLAELKAMLADDTEFLAKLTVMCKEKKKEYEERVQRRANEEAAIAQAIAVLNSDAAFEKLGKTAAAKEALLAKKTRVAAASRRATTFLQLRAARHATAIDRGEEAQDILREAANKAGSTRLLQVVALLEEGNPFAKVLAAIEHMLGVLAAEGEADKKDLGWCKSQIADNGALLDTQEQAVTDLEHSIEALNILIHDPETGLLAQIQETEGAFTKNHESQASETSKRAEENRNYQTDVKHMVEAEEVLNRATKILKDHFKKLEGENAKRTESFSMAQLGREDPAPPETFEGNGQGEQGNKVIDLLEFILSEMQKEEMKAHKDEEAAQHSFEDQMADLKTEERDLMKSLAQLKATVSTKEADLLEKKQDLEKEIGGKEATKAYLEKIKPGCEFITTHFEAREAARVSEEKALKKAVRLLKQSSAYQSAAKETK